MMAQMEVESGRRHFELNVIINILEMSPEFWIFTYWWMIETIVLPFNYLLIGCLFQKEE